MLPDLSNLEGPGTYFMSLCFSLRWLCRSTNYCNSSNQLQMNQYFKPKPVTHSLGFLYFLPIYEPISTTMKLVWLVLVAYVCHWQWSRFKSTQTMWADMECGKGVPNKSRMLVSRKGVNWLYHLKACHHKCWGAIQSWRGKHSIEKRDHTKKEDRKRV